VAMELVDGQTLKAWRLESRPSVADSLSVCIAAGRGLVAAHAEGLVHRDFKPDNIMVARDGRVLVMDFGLARGSDEAFASSSISSGELSPSLVSGELTQTGTVLGTPAYMSPEQFGGDVADERSDQFAFCATVWELLYGERPFHGDSLATLASAVRSGEIEPVPKSVRVPARIRTALRRGLSANPEDRFPSMSALLGALAPKRNRLGLGMLATGGLGVVAVAAAVTGSGLAPAEDPCLGAESAAGRVWTQARTTAAATTFAATELPFADSAWQLAEARLDEFFVGWAAARTEVCRATHVRHEQSEARLDLRMDCLDEALNYADAALTELAAADAGLVTRSLDYLERLPDPVRCQTLVADHQRAKRSDRDRDAISEARVDAGRETTAKEAADEGLTALGMIEAPELRSDLLAFRARGYEALGELDEAKEAIREGLKVATKAGLARAEADLWLSLMRIVGTVEKHGEAARTIELPARLAVERADDPLMQMKIEQLTGTVIAMDAKGAEAIPYFERAVEIIEDAKLSASHAAVVHNNFGLALYDLARYEDALEHHRIAHQAQLSLWGEGHPSVATDLSNMGRVYSAMGEIEKARDHYERAVALRRRLLGHEHSSVADVLLNLGVLDNSTGERVTARARVEEAKRIYEKTLGPAHPYVGFSYLALGNIAREDHRYEDALALNDKALENLRAHFGPTHSKTLSPMVNRATILSDMDRDAEAVVAYEEVLKIEETVRGPDDVGLAYGLMGLAQALIDLGRNEESLAPARRAQALRERAGIDPRLVAETVFVTAMAEWAADDTRAHALELARAAAHTTRPDGPTSSALHEQINAWIAERTAPGEESSAAASDPPRSPAH
ncbi:MAG: serine/threonine-protein kinase, partial [Myxococcota bacterium]